MTCDIAATGEEGLEKVKLRHARMDDYDLVLIDWKMPELDGVETTRRIREAVGSHMPIIILTSYNWDEIAEEARRAGVDTFVAKPLFAGSVMDQFREAFRRGVAAGTASVMTDGTQLIRLDDYHALLDRVTIREV